MRRCPSRWSYPQSRTPTSGWRLQRRHNPSASAISGCLRLLRRFGTDACPRRNVNSAADSPGICCAATYPSGRWPPSPPAATPRSACCDPATSCPPGTRTPPRSPPAPRPPATRSIPTSSSTPLPAAHWPRPGTPDAAPSRDPLAGCAVLLRTSYAKGGMQVGHG
jgi:hypothetical protein